mmetsp:Transcript_18777/g.45006  ORF Transcript_18777/g.45006 Transcript_18777/m.45006 type:complete len:396 (-) Transcript_18777:460-1647(-)
MCHDDARRAPPCRRCSRGGARSATVCPGHPFLALSPSSLSSSLSSNPSCYHSTPRASQPVPPWPVWRVGPPWLRIPPQRPCGADRHAAGRPLDPVLPTRPRWVVTAWRDRLFGAVPHHHQSAGQGSPLARPLVSAWSSVWPRPSPLCVRAAGVAAREPDHGVSAPVHLGPSSCAAALSVDPPDERPGLSGNDAAQHWDRRGPEGGSDPRIVCARHREALVWFVVRDAPRLSLPGDISCMHDCHPWFGTWPRKHTSSSPRYAPLTFDDNPCKCHCHSWSGTTPHMLCTSGFEVGPFRALEAVVFLARDALSDDGLVGPHQHGVDGSHHLGLDSHIATQSLRPSVCSPMGWGWSAPEASRTEKATSRVPGRVRFCGKLPAALVFLVLAPRGTSAGQR